MAARDEQTINFEAGFLSRLISLRFHSLSPIEFNGGFYVRATRGAEKRKFRVCREEMRQAIAQGTQAELIERTVNKDPASSHSGSVPV